MSGYSTKISWGCYHHDVHIARCERQEQGCSDFDRKRQNEHQAVQGRGAAIQPAERPRLILVVAALPRRQDWRDDGPLTEKERSSAQR